MRAMITRASLTVRFCRGNVASIQATGLSPMENRARSRISLIIIKTTKKKRKRLIIKKTLSK